jgi:uncharacterized membrane protein YjjP (DUF1212 family)
MRAFLVGLKAAFLERVFGAWKSTLVGFGLAALVLVLDQTVLALTALPEGWAKVLATLIALAGAALRKKATAYPQPAP